MEDWFFSSPPPQAYPDSVRLCSLASTVYFNCPESPYSEEAGKAKLQRNVTLRVLIGTDGRAVRIQLVQGLGLGLDEQAIQAVRSWRFVPPQDARRPSVPIWVTIETRFQLFQAFNAGFSAYDTSAVV